MILSESRIVRAKKGTTMAEDKFKPGDIVRCVTGGPKMAVQRRLSAAYGPRALMYVCSWFIGHKLNEGHFTQEQLELVADDDA